jgi:predicted Zn-dependent protease
MKLTEENELKEITDDFSKGVTLIKKKMYKEAQTSLDELINKYQHTEYYSVMEILARSKVYRAIAASQLNPVQIKLESEQDYLNEGIYSLNAGNGSRAIELFSDLNKKNPKNPYFLYLLALAYSQQDNQANSLKYLKECINIDSSYKIRAFNESGFLKIAEDDEFNALVECK